MPNVLNEYMMMMMMTYKKSIFNQICFTVTYTIMSESYNYV